MSWLSSYGVTFVKLKGIKTTLNLLINKTEQQQEQQSTTKNTGKGSRTRTISGAALKSKLRSGEIPNT